MRGNSAFGMMSKINMKSPNDYRRVIRLGRVAIACAFFSGSILASAATANLRVLFLGDNGHHRPADRFKQLQPVLANKGIELDYTDKLDDLNSAKLSGYDALAIYANWTRIAREQEQAILDFVQRGGGLVPLHCASYCFLN